MSRIMLLRKNPLSPLLQFSHLVRNIYLLVHYIYIVIKRRLLVDKTTSLYQFRSPIFCILYIRHVCACGMWKSNESDPNNVAKKVSLWSSSTFREGGSYSYLCFAMRKRDVRWGVIGGANSTFVTFFGTKVRMFKPLSLIISYST